MLKGRHPETGDSITPAKLDYLFREAMRSSEFFLTARRQIKPEYFEHVSEPHYRALWDVFCRLVDQYGVQAMFADPARMQTFVGTELQNYLVNHPEAVVQEHWPQLLSADPLQPGLLYWIYTASAAELNLAPARQYLQQFLHERSVQRPLQRTLAEAGRRPINNLPAMLRTYLEQDVAIKSIGSSPVKSIAPDGWRPQPLPKYPTGVSFLDVAMGGGQVDGEVYGVLGAYGSGKTMLAVQLACQSAVYQVTQADLARRAGKQYLPKHSYLFHYEAGEDEIRIRTWSHLCELDWRGLLDSGFDGLSSLDGPIKPKPYELERHRRQQAAPDAFLAEKERVATRLPRYRDYIHQIDMSGPDTNPKQGTGYVQEIAEILAAHGQPAGQIGAVIIDYAGLCARRHIAANNLKIEHMRHYVGDFGDQCRRQIAAAFRCPVWIFHQLSAASNKRSAAVRQHHADAAEAKNFAENVHFCFSLGVPDEQYRCTQLTNSKARRAVPAQTALLRINGQFSTIERADDYYMDTSGRVLPISEASSLFVDKVLVSGGFATTTEVDPHEVDE